SRRRRCGSDRRSGLLGLVAPARPQVEDARDERRYREDEIRINGFSWHPVEGLPCVGSVYESIAKTPACGPAPILRVDAFRCSMPFVFASRTGLNRAADYKAP